MGKIININTHKDYKFQEDWSWLADAKKLMDERVAKDMEFYFNESLWENDDTDRGA